MRGDLPGPRLPEGDEVDEEEIMKTVEERKVGCKGRRSGAGGEAQTEAANEMVKERNVKKRREKAEEEEESGRVKDSRGEAKAEEDAAERVEDSRGEAEEEGEEESETVEDCRREGEGRMKICCGKRF